MKIRIILIFVSLDLLYSEDAYILQKYQNGRFFTISEKNPHFVTMPGSLFKLLTASYLLEHTKNPKQNLNKKIFCSGKKLYQKKCWNNRGHGWIDFEAALAHSCNFYFLEITQGIPVENYINFLKTEFSLPAEVSSYSRNIFLGEDLSRPLTLREIAEILNRFYLKIKQDKYFPIRKAIGQAKRGTLAELVSNLEKASSLKILGGKTGSTNWQRPIAGMVYLLLKNSQEENFTLLFYHRGTMGAKIPVKNIIPVLKLIKP